MLSTFLFSLALGFSPAARAESWVVVVKAEEKIDPKLIRIVQEAAKSSLKKVNRRNKWVNPPEASLDDIILALGCEKWGNKCAAAVGNMMSASRTLVVELKQHGDGVSTDLLVVNNRGKTLQRSHATLLKDRLNDDLPFFIRSMLTRKPATRWVIKSEPLGATVYVDGKELGRTPLVIENKLKPGAHLLKLSLEGRDDFSKKTLLAKGTRTLSIHQFGRTGASNGEPEKSAQKSPDTKIGAPVLIAPPNETQAASLPPVLTYSGLALVGIGAATMVGLGVVYAVAYDTYLNTIGDNCLVSNPNPCVTDNVAAVEEVSNVLNVTLVVVVIGEVLGGVAVVSGLGLATVGYALE